MGLRFNRRIKICKGVTLNFGKKGMSTTIGTKGCKATFGKNGVRTTVGIPGSGLSYTNYVKKDKHPIPIENSLPEGIKIPKYDKKVNYMMIATIASMILGIIFPLLLLLAFPMAIFNLIYLAINRSFRNSFYTQAAIKHFKLGNAEKCRKYCDKALALDPSNNSAMIMLEIVSQHLS